MKQKILDRIEKLTAEKNKSKDALDKVELCARIAELYLVLNLTK